MFKGKCLDLVPTYVGQRRSIAPLLWQPSVVVLSAQVWYRGRKYTNKIKRGSRLEPLDLSLVEGVGKRNILNGDDELSVRVPKGRFIPRSSHFHA